LVPYVDHFALVSAINRTTKRQIGDARQMLSAYNDRYCGMIVNRMELGQYRRNIKDYDYFHDDNLRRSHKRYMKKAGKESKDENLRRSHMSFIKKDFKKSKDETRGLVEYEGKD
jgi:hypothetical protein